MRVFTINNARDRGKVHADVFGNILEHHRLDVLDTFVEKIALPRNNTFDNAIDRLPAMFDIAKQVDRRTNLFFYKILGFLGRIALIQQADDMSG